MTEHWQRHDERMALHEHLIRTLRLAASSHPRDFDHERRAVMDAANLWALAHEGCETVTATTVDRCDTMASGHIDWVSKFPLYVSERVYGFVLDA